MLRFVLSRFCLVLYSAVCVLTSYFFVKNFENEEDAARPGSRREKRDAQGRQETDGSSSGGGNRVGKVKLPTAMR